MIPRSLSLVLACALGAACTTFIGLRPLAPPTYRGIHPRHTVVEGDDTRWTRAYAKVELRDRGWRPYRVQLALRAPDDAPPDGIAVRLAVDDETLQELRVGAQWTALSFDIRRQSATPGVLGLQIFSTVSGDDPTGVGVARVSAHPLLVSMRGLLVAVLGALLGTCVWLLAPSRRAWLQRFEAPATPPTTRVIVTALGAGLCLAAPLIPFAFDWEPVGAVHGVWLAASCLTLALLGRIAARETERVFGAAAFPLYRSPIVELVTGLVATTLLIYLWSFAVKRIGGRITPVEHVLPWLVPLGIALTAALAFVSTAARRTTRDVRRPEASIRPLWWTPHDLIALAAFLALCAWLAAPHLGALRGYSSDPDQHIFWTNQIVLHGFVPDHYLQTRSWINYPLGLHSMAVALIGWTPLPAAAVINLLPTLASTVFVVLACQAAFILGADGCASESAVGRVARMALIAAAAASFDSGTFGPWNNLEGTGRLSAGLLLIAPFLVAASAAWAASPFGSAGTGTALPTPALAPAAMALGLLLVVGFTLNPTLLLLQAVTSGIALATIVMSGWIGRPAAGHGKSGAVARCAAIGVAIGVAVAITDPYSYRPLAKRAGVAVDDQALLRWTSDFNEYFQDRTCLALPCLARAVDAHAIGSAAVRPLAVMVPGAIDHLRREPQPDTAPDESWPGFPDLTGFGSSPVHGWIVNLLAVAPLLTLATWRLHTRRFLLLLAATLVACSVDAVLRTWIARLVHPGDAALHLAPHYTGRAASVYFNQSLWPMLLCGIAMAVERVTSRRHVQPFVHGAIVLGCVALAASASGRLDERWQRLNPSPMRLTPSDLRDLWRLERDVMTGDATYFVSSIVKPAIGEKWVFSDDRAAPIYVQSSRPALFLYGLSHAGQYTPTDSARVCGEIVAGVRYPVELDRHDARWMAVLAATPEEADDQARGRLFCKRPIGEVFPDARREASRGRVHLFRLW